MTRLEQKRQSILKAMGEITSLRQGSLTEQYVTRTDDDGHRRKLGPYYVHTWYTNGEKQTEHISQSEAPEMQSLIQNYQKMKDLFDDLLDVIEQMTLRRSSGQALKK